MMRRNSISAAVLVLLSHDRFALALAFPFLPPNRQVRYQQRRSFATLEISSRLYANLDEEREPEEEKELPSIVPVSADPKVAPEQYSFFDPDDTKSFDFEALKMALSDLPPQSVILLNLVAIIWGSQHAVIKTVVEDVDPSAFTLLRFGLAAAIASPYTPGLKNDWWKDNNALDLWTAWRWGLEMGFWMFLGFSFQAVGLEYTTAQKSGFLLYLNVKFVPFFGRLLFGREIRPATWISALTAFCGTALLATGGDGALDWNVGDGWSVAAAMASAMFILRLEQASAAVPNSASLNAACLWIVAVMAALWTWLAGDAAVWDDVGTLVVSHGWEIVYLGGITTALANWVQTKAQKDVSAERASIIYAMDPVYGAAFSYWLLGEELNGVAGWIGAGLITVAAATNAFLDLSKNEIDDGLINGSKVNGASINGASTELKVPR